MRFQLAMHPLPLALCSVQHAVSKESLRRLGAGHLSRAELRDHGVYDANYGIAFPMANAAGEVVGIKILLDNGATLSVAGGRDGVFLPTPFPRSTDRVLIADGPIETAALLDLGLHAIGRPAGRGSGQDILQWLRRRAPMSVVIVSLRDESSGQRSMELARALYPYCEQVRVIRPPEGIDDAWEWKLRGATANDLETAIRSATPLAKPVAPKRTRAPR